MCNQSVCSISVRTAMVDLQEDQQQGLKLKSEEQDTYTHKGARHRRRKRIRIKICHIKTNTALKVEEASNPRALLCPKYPANSQAYKSTSHSRTLVLLPPLSPSQIQFRCKVANATSSEHPTKSRTQTVLIAMLTSSSFFNRCTSSPPTTSLAQQDQAPVMVSKTNMATPTSS
jgi:hypothetical protein